MNKKLLHVSLLLIGIVAVSSVGIVHAKPIKNIPPWKTHRMIESGYRKGFHRLLILSVQPNLEYREGHIPGAYNVPNDYLPLADALTYWFDLYGYYYLNDKNTLVIVHCTDESISPTAVPILIDIGLKKVYSLEGGTIAWVYEGYELQTEDPPLPI